jgi:hypothetical protein
MALFDKDQDRAISAAELAAAPALADGAARIDADRDGALTREELLSRFEQLAAGADLIGISLTVLGSKGPLAGAKVTLTREPFQGEGMQSYSCTTDESGTCFPEGAEVQLSGVPTGFYLVEVVHEATGVDEKLGREIASDASGNRVELRVGKGPGR